MFALLLYEYCFWQIWKLSHSIQNRLSTATLVAGVNCINILFIDCDIKISRITFEKVKQSFPKLVWLISDLILEETTGQVSGFGARPTAVLAVVLVAAELVLDHLREKLHFRPKKTYIKSLVECSPTLAI
jgi:hypothetical protein